MSRQCDYTASSHDLDRAIRFHATAETYLIYLHSATDLACVQQGQQVSFVLSITWVTISKCTGC